MPNNIRPVVLLLILFAIVLFLAGFRLGKYIERIDKTYVPSPRAGGLPPQLTQTKPAPQCPRMTIYKHKECKISFLYPDNLEEETISSQEARLKDGNNNLLFSCDRRTVFKKREAMAELESDKTATISGQKVPLYEKNVDVMMFTVINPLLNRSVFFEVSKNHFELVFQTLKFNY